LKRKKTVIILILCCCSCASKAATRENNLYVFLTNSSKFFLLPTGGIEKTMDTAQRIHAEYDGKDYFFNAWVKADEAGIEMILLNELGVNMGELSYRGGLVSFSSPVFPKSLKPEYIIADFQLCFYNTPALRHALEECGLSLENMENSRRIFHGKTVIIEIEKNKNAVKFVNHLRGYAYTLEGDFE
jgi:hypothetical protein